MNKLALKSCLLDYLDETINAALAAANDARDTAAHKDNQPENQYDTLSLEAAYLAHGQSERVQQLQTQRSRISTWPVANVENDKQAEASDEDLIIALGSLVTLTPLSKKNGSEETVKSHGTEQLLVWIAPIGGFSLEFEQHRIQLISTETPLAQALTGHYCGDYVLLNPGQEYEILAVA